MHAGQLPLPSAGPDEQARLFQRRDGHVGAATSNSFGISICARRILPPLLMLGSSARTVSRRLEYRTRV